VHFHSLRGFTLLALTNEN